MVNSKVMVIHVALFKFKQEVPKEQIEKIMEEVRNFKDKIPQIVEIYAGKNFSRHSQGFTHAIVIKFESRKNLDAYRAHPNHKPIAEKLEEMEEDSIGVDFEV
jgi:hypothetical protein